VGQGSFPFIHLQDDEKRGDQQDEPNEKEKKISFFYRSGKVFFKCCIGITEGEKK
jgi:hypothetical protein